MEALVNQLKASVGETMTFKFGFAALAATLALAVMPGAMANDQGDFYDQAHGASNSQQHQRRQLEGRHEDNLDFRNGVNGYNDESSGLRHCAAWDADRRDEHQNFRNRLNSSSASNYGNYRALGNGYNRNYIGYNGNTALNRHQAHQAARDGQVRADQQQAYGYLNNQNGQRSKKWM